MDPMYVTYAVLYAVLQEGVTFQREGDTVYVCWQGARTSKSWTKPT